MNWTWEDLNWILRSIAGLFIPVQEKNAAFLGDVSFKTFSLWINQSGQLIYCPFYKNDVQERKNKS